MDSQSSCLKQKYDMLVGENVVECGADEVTLKCVPGIDVGRNLGF